MPAAVVTTLVLWASAFVGIRAVGATFSPGPMALLRLVVGTVALTAFALVRRSPAGPCPPSRRSLAADRRATGWRGSPGYTVVLNAAERHLDAGTAAMLVNVRPDPGRRRAAGTLLGEGWPRRLLVGILVSFAGVMIIAADGAIRAAPTGSASSSAWSPPSSTPRACWCRRWRCAPTDALTATWLGCAAGAAVLLPFGPEAASELARAPGARPSPPWCTWACSRRPSASRCGPSR